MEKIIISNLRKKKLFSNEVYTLVVTGEISIFALVTSKILNEEVAKARAIAKSDGKGFFGQWGAQLGASFSFGERYKSMDDKTILSENPKNFEIANQSISKVTERLDLNNNKNSYIITIVASGVKYAFVSPISQVDNLRKAYRERFN